MARAACCCGESPAALPPIPDDTGERGRGQVFDPEGEELRALHGAARFPGARVLEIGAGDGRLSSRLAEVAGQVVGVDLAAGTLASARRSRSRELAGRLHFQRADARWLPFRGGSFDIALLGWSL